MRETDYRTLVANKLAAERTTIVEELQLRYEIGKYGRGKTEGMPDFSLDIVTFQKGFGFELFELKLLDNSEIWTGKFMGQMLAYNFLFKTEPWNELAGRFVMRSHKNPALVRGKIGAVLAHLSEYGKGEVAEPDDRCAEFKGLNLVVRGGKGFELAAKYNPAIWSYWVEFGELLTHQEIEFNVFHFYEDLSEYFLDPLTNLSIDAGGLRPGARMAYDNSRNG